MKELVLSKTLPRSCFFAGITAIIIGLYVPEFLSIVHTIKNGENNKKRTLRQENNSKAKGNKVNSTKLL
jgi:hypothetical protein